MERFLVSFQSFHAWNSSHVILQTASKYLFKQIPIVLTIAFACNLIFTIYAIIKRAKIAQSIYYSSINLLIWMIPVIVLGYLQIKQILIPLCFYSKYSFKSVTIELIITLKYVTKKSQMLGKFLILMETIMIALKVDNRI